MTTSKSGLYPRLAIACQGGGAITAFQAGVLGELLKHSRRDGARTLIDLRDFVAPRAHKTYELIAFSGTSGGAMNASACWVACALNDPAKAGDRLAKFWQAMTARACDPTVMGYWFNAIQRLTTQLATGWWQADFDPEVWQSQKV